MNRPCIAFTGGGTGGHVYPGLAVIERLRERWDGRIVWIGSGKEVERSAVEAAGVEFFSIPSGKLRRSLSARNVPDAFRVLAGYFAARGLLRRLKPAILFSKGGYVSVPPCMAASSLGIPVFTHESDLSPGLATRLNARRADRILLSWEKTLGFLPEAQRPRATVTGNPVRAAIGNGDADAGREWLGFGPDLPVILVLGGSQGARQVNELIAAALPALAGKARVAHQTGPGNEPCRPDDDGYRGFEYVKEELPDVYAAADIIVGRAGAGTLWEGAAAFKPMVFIPLAGSASRGDQVENAELLAAAGAAICLTGASATTEALVAALGPLMTSPDARRAMAEAARRMAKPDAAQAIADLILARIRKGCTP
ncbi:MAG: undecaprenyldiphospho-muramoylpentapeptide beta-N-acetylglucosaminyltransferase [Spirochaetae bacterium HGW-Spirochaetae-3]|jgi:UDP-N-acetylglucosamine--N-acetylmuramyl-(pentapeptide) pyrophosphoryl-undecaprenol N-acetylglucosamine transferase|nr:MAG: undecaprenyldiphospho-muramoylpentapeptide beta-N-acetylglucosaminyltransferase [Spirochaetae bacterium HGW-Spirochaetae-3]